MDKLHHIEDTTRTGAAAPRNGLPTSVLVIGGALLLVIGGLAAALVLRQPATAPVAAEAAASLSTTTAAAKPIAKVTSNTTKGSTDRSGGDGGDGTVGSTPTSRNTAAAQVCASCGVVESVRAVQVKGEGTGLGAVAGGVLGGVVGHQMGGGDGKKALTVLGAVGGGVAGHQVEKHARSNTVYEVRVRMDDRSLRTLTSPQAVKAGDRVTVDGETLRVRG